MTQPNADGPVSGPIFHPDLESVTFNGFAWSMTNGIIHQSNVPDPGDPLDSIPGPS